MILSISRWETRTLYYVRSCCCQEGFWEICWLSSGHRNHYQPATVMRLSLSCEGGSTNRDYVFFHLFPLFLKDPSFTEAGLGWWHVAHGRLWWGQCWKLGSKGYSMCINYPTYIAICSRTLIFVICGLKSAPNFSIFNWKTFRLFPMFYGRFSVASQLIL